MLDLKQEILACGEWMLRNQVDHEWDANNGRVLWCYESDTGHSCLGNNWLVGISSLCFLALYKYSEEQRFLEAAERAGQYVMSSQIVDAEEPRFYGAIRECTPQTEQFCPRDATSAAWSLVWLYEATKKPEYLRRACLFGDWHLKYGMNGRWPIWHIEMNPDKQNSYWAGAFQSGTGLFYHDLFMISDDSRYIQRGFKPIAETYRDDFFESDGKLIGIRDGLTWDILDIPDYGMHYYNDDFGAAMLEAASDFYRNDSYRNTAYRYAQWLAAQQQEDGSFGEEYPSGVPVSLMYFHDLGTHYQDDILLAARDRALDKLLSLQSRKTGISQMYGGFHGALESGWSSPKPSKTAVNLRTTAYALIALLKLQGEVKNIWLGRNNTKYCDPNTKRKKAQFMNDG